VEWILDMPNAPDPDLIKTTEIFLIPCSFLVAALGTADTNAHRAAVSVIGLVVSITWWVCSREALTEIRQSHADPSAYRMSRRVRIMFWLPIFFAVCWFVSIVAHVMLLGRPLGH
jgi:hypothetical protein